MQQKGDTMKINNYSFLLALITCLILSGCSFSTSSKHSFKSSTSPSRSSSKNSTKSVDTTSASYKEDVTSLTILYVGSVGSTRDFQRELSQISKTHGISTWENNPNTYDAIGVGLKKAKVAKSDTATLPFLEGLKDSKYYPRVTASL